MLGDAGTIALVKNRKNLEGWFFPKGKIDPGETDEEAARREIHEEAGLTNLEFIDDLGTYERPRINPDGTDAPEVKSIHMYLFAAPPHANVSPSMEIEEAAWMPLPKVMDSLLNAKDRAWFVTVFERVRLAVQRD